MKLINRIVFLSALATAGALSLVASPSDAPPLALTDPRMDDYYATQIRPPTIIVRLINGTSEGRATLDVSVNELQFSKLKGRVRLASPQEDGSYRAELPRGFPLQQAYLRVGAALGGFLLRDNLEVTIDLSVIGKSLSSTEPGVTLDGTDAGMNRAVHRFAAFRGEEVVKIRDRQDDIVTRGKTSFEEALKEINTLQVGLENMLSESGEVEYLWLLRHQLETSYLTNVLRLAFRAKVDLMETPVREKILAYQPLVVGRETFNLLQTFSVNARNAATRQVARKKGQQAIHADIWATDEQLQIERVLTFLEIGRSSARPDLNRLAVSVFFADTRMLTIGAAQQLVDKIDPEWLRKTYQRELGLGASKASVPQLGAEKDWFASSLAVLPSGARLFKFPDLSGPDLISALRSAHANKALLLDFWGDWCAPCLRALPKSKVMYADLAGDPVEFVYLACRMDEAAWRKIVNEQQLPGLHVLLTEAQLLQLQESFAFTSFPFYQVVDLTGQMKEVTRVFDSPSVQTFRTVLKLPSRD